MKIFKKIIATVLVVMICLTSAPLDGIVDSDILSGISQLFETQAAASGTYGDFTYSVSDDGTVSITAYDGSSAAVVIPSEIDGATVTTIENDVFSGCTSLESIEIPDSVIMIGCGAFEDCTSLTDVTLSKGLVTLGARAFQNCTALY